MRRSQQQFEHPCCHVRQDKGSLNGVLLREIEKSLRVYLKKAIRIS
jgi:hypothetical protein